MDPNIIKEILYQSNPNLDIAEIETMQQNMTEASITRNEHEHETKSLYLGDLDELSVNCSAELLVEVSTMHAQNRSRLTTENKSDDGQIIIVDEEYENQINEYEQKEISNEDDADDQWLNDVNLDCDSLLKGVIEYSPRGAKPITNKPQTPLDDIDDHDVEIPDNITPFSSASIYEKIATERKQKCEQEEKINDMVHSAIRAISTTTESLYLASIDDKNEEDDPQSNDKANHLLSTHNTDDEEYNTITRKWQNNRKNSAHDDSVLNSNEWWIDEQYYCARSASIDFDHVNSIKVNGNIIQLHK